MRKAIKTVRCVPIQPSNWNRKQLKSILNAFSGKKILVVGDVGLDRYTIGNVERISPEAPVPIVVVEQELLKLGLAANVADNVQALGAEPLLAGVVGVDRTGEDFCRILDRSGISSRHLIRDRSRRTVLKERIVSERQQLLRVDYETMDAVSERVQARLIARVEHLARKADAVILEDYAKGLFNKRLVHSIVSAAKESGKIVSVDPNAKTPVDVYRGAYVLTPNTREAEALSGVRIEDEPSLLEAGERILDSTHATHVVITRGKEGMAIFTTGRRECHLIPTYAREVYDVSGAGDTVISVLTLALSCGASMEEAVVLGNLAAGVEVAKKGTATVSPDEIKVAMEFFVG